MSFPSSVDWEVYYISLILYFNIVMDSHIIDGSCNFAFRSCISSRIRGLAAFGCRTRK